MFEPLPTQSAISYIVSGICAEYDYMKIWLTGPDIGFFITFGLDITEPIDHEKYHRRLETLFGSYPGLAFMHHEFPGSQRPKLFCDMRSMRLASYYFWSPENSIAARTADMYNRFKTLGVYMERVNLWEKRAPAIGLVLFFSAVSPMLDSVRS